MSGAFKGFSMKVWGFILIVVAVTITMSRVEFYASEPITGQVIEAETNKPVADANIVFLWESVTGSHDHREGLIEVREAVTDADGRYSVEGWGPMRNPWSGHMKADQPQMIIFHPYFYPKFMHNEAPIGPFDTLKPTGRAKEFAAIPFYWNGRVVTLEKAQDKVAFYSQLGTMQNAARLLYVPQKCEWVKAARFLIAVEKFRLRANEDGYEPLQYRTLDNLRLRNSCGDAELILGERR